MLQVMPGDGPPPIRASRGIQRSALMQPESPAHRDNRLELNNFAFIASQVQAARVMAGPRIVRPGWQVISLDHWLAPHKQQGGRL